MPGPTDMTVFSLMKSRMQMLGERQKIVAENVANVNTPDFTPRDVDQDAFSRTMERVAGQGHGGGVDRPAMAVTQAGHMTATPGGGPSLSIQRTPDSETTLDGNSVVVEEQMMKIAETRMDFETMVGLYQKSLGLLRLASRSPR
jgi:flagellar basal-body rod protein FlgB